MARGGRGGSAPPRRTVDLTGIITSTEKSDLVLLVTAITEKMFRDINGLFDSPQIPLMDGEGPERNWLALALRQQEINDKENAVPSRSFANRPVTSTARKSSPNHLDQDVESTPQLQELRNEAVAFFRKWQLSVVQRLRDLAVTTVEDDFSRRGRGRGARGVPRGRAGRGAGRGGRQNGRGGASIATTAVVPNAFPQTPTSHVDPTLVRLYPAVPNNLWPLPYERRKLLLHIMLLVVLSLHDYNANARLLLVNLTSSLNLPLKLHNQDEMRIAKGLAAAAMEVSPEKAAAQKEENKLSKRWKFSLGTTGMGTTGLAGALVGVGVGCEGSGLTASAAAALLGIMSENGLLMGSLFGMNPAKPVEKMVETFLREIQDFSFLSLTDAGDTEYMDPRQPLPAERRLRIVIALGGFMLKGDAVTTPWSSLSRQAEVYVVQWDLTAVASLGNALETVIGSSAWLAAREQIRKDSIFHCLLNSKWPEPLLKISKIIDNPWSLGMVRAEKLGAILADAIVRHKFHGERSVSLVGYSLAARAIYMCLMVLAERRQFGLVDSVVMMGTPAPSDSKVWMAMKSVVSGRLINAYTEQDYLLGFLYRTSNTHSGIAGLQEIVGAGGVENHHVKHLPNGHLSYQHLAAQILEDVGWEHDSFLTV
ncbi:DUF726 domain protein [Cordyceps fumosorosea ARSEF 2679]|uniref:DUF726 domain protein n=1 Tax=Cordyceps fumosorosea (strain ARSEF 2679) TaxID=1081104 RepID=A0A162LJ02_CORFA|nr:DUF726 domain protein [Cordyceps fumosorosea ARSEF 2679]OAA71194.1 DUF726 domain protein [Cordyceps fumosorosea ARSEF 2679]